MTGHRHEPASRPEDLSRYFVERANAGDVDGLVALYEPDAVLAFPPGHISRGSAAIRDAYAALLTNRPTFTPGEQRTTLLGDDLALTSTRLDDGGVTVEVARRQSDGSWLWALDDPAFLR